MGGKGRIKGRWGEGEGGVSEEEKGRYQRKKKLYEKGIIASYIEKKTTKKHGSFSSRYTF